MKKPNTEKRPRLYMTAFPIPLGLSIGAARELADTLVGIPIADVPAALGTDDKFGAGTVTATRLTTLKKKLGRKVVGKRRVIEVTFEVTDEEVAQAEAELQAERGGVPA